MKMLNLGVPKAEFEATMDDVDLVLDATESSIGAQIKGMSLVLMFAGYERLLNDICKELLRTASSYRGSASRLTAGFRTVYIYPKLESFRNCSRAKRWCDSAIKVSKAFDDVNVLLAEGFFPDDGSYMEQSQVQAFCSFFGLTNPEVSLRDAWNRIPEIREARNAIAHGRERCSFYGGRYSAKELKNLSQVWRRGWLGFAQQVEVDAKSTGFWHT